ncbi:Histidine kinase-, DNA gyrase B-, and HSP90-like ATPase [Marinitoga hydrogenitolerans DSM 16785]|uniref:histidine kinase n=1 Tax=Marinitoga hydrogenitolerans (strain DSM 16785 / JCM 12826 / AT1271) TaxID=1122195 RepID=A0A1M4Z7C9_MARH1|nr:ATP-binding protein [Marinitoga hydrogenitolerans]SHF13858.1 Histidine kinase-, DNA gyrase B-, and HSP90-like ATPase [Marinitoga hydrogenitolerans DSM 16785]
MTTLKTISDHILDICENAVKSDGNKGYLIIIETEKYFRFCVSDNGRGMDKVEIDRALDPFFTTKKERKKKFGLGLSFLKYSVEKTNGYFKIISEKMKGTTVIAQFNLKNIDCQPIGDIPNTILNVLNMEQNFMWKITRFFKKEGYEIESEYLKNNFDLTKSKDLMLIKKYIVNLEKEIKEGL